MRVVGQVIVCHLSRSFRRNEAHRDTTCPAGQRAYRPAQRAPQTTSTRQPAAARASAARRSRARIRRGFFACQKSVRVAGSWRIGLCSRPRSDCRTGTARGPAGQRCECTGCCGWCIGFGSRPQSDSQSDCRAGAARGVAEQRCARPLAARPASAAVALRHQLDRAPEGAGPRGTGRGERRRFAALAR